MISDKDENAINTGKHVVLFHLSKYSEKLYGNIVYKMQIEMSNFIQVPASLVFAAVSEFWFSGFSRFTIYKLTTAVTAFLIAFLIKSNNNKLGQITFKLLTLRKYFTCNIKQYFLFCFAHVEHSWTSLEGI